MEICRLILSILANLSIIIGMTLLYYRVNKSIKERISKVEKPKEDPYKDYRNANGLLGRKKDALDEKRN